VRGNWLNLGSVEVSTRVVLLILLDALRDQADPVLRWLLAGDPAIRWQVLRDLTDAKRSVWEAERRRVARTGWGARLLQEQAADGTWGGGLYSPKWTSTTYTLFLLRDLGLPASHPAARKGCRLLLDRGLWSDGGIDLSVTTRRSETCMTGMVFSLAVCFQPEDARIETIVRHLLEEQMPDCGWNCERWRGATHSSFHTTINVLEGLQEYALTHGASSTQAADAAARGQEFLLAHQLFRSHRTGQIVHPSLTRFSFPPRWHYDILRALDLFRAANADLDPRLADAVALIEKRRRRDGRWLLQNRHPGRTFFEMESVGQPSRWNTLRALRVLRWWRGR